MIIRNGIFHSNPFLSVRRQLVDSVEGVFEMISCSLLYNIFCIPPFRSSQIMTDSAIVRGFLFRKPTSILLSSLFCWGSATQTSSDTGNFA